MNAFPEMHDGFFDGLWISGNDKTVHLFLRTDTGERSTIVLKDVERMNVLNVKAGNIIFGVVLVDSGKLTLQHIERLYETSDTDKLKQILQTARQRQLSVLELTASYGAEGTVLFVSAEILSGHVLPAPNLPTPT
jgi:hypothetical protein